MLHTWQQQKSEFTSQPNIFKCFSKLVDHLKTDHKDTWLSSQTEGKLERYLTVIDEYLTRYGQWYPFHFPFRYCQIIKTSMFCFIIPLAFSNFCTLNIKLIKLKQPLHKNI